MTQKTTTLTPEETAIARRDLETNGAAQAAPRVVTTSPVDPQPVDRQVAGREPAVKTDADAKPGKPNIAEDASLQNAGSKFKDVNRGNRSSMDG